MTKESSDIPKTATWQVGDKRSISHTFTDDDLKIFSNLTGDTNPLHMNEEFAIHSSAGGQVVHGMLAASFVSTLIGIHIPGSGALWNSFNINWRKIIRIGDTLCFEARVSAIQTATKMMDLEITGANELTGDIYLDCKARVMMTNETRVVKHSTLAGKRVLVTGASGVIGKAICIALAEAGCSLTLWGRDVKRLHQVVQSLGECNVSFHTVDLLNNQMVDHALNNLIRDGGVDGVVHAAAAPLDFVGVESPANHQLLQNHIQVEVMALEAIARTISKSMDSDGFIIAILTQAVFDAPPIKMSAYVTAKMAAWGLIRALAVELGPKGIRCNAVSPNIVDTPYIKDMPMRTKQVEIATNPVRRLCTADDVANAVVYLAGSQASYINGINLPVSGGSRMP